MKTAIVLLFFLLPNISFAHNVDVFTEPSIFNEPLAYPRSPGDLGLSINTTTYAKQRVYYLEGIIGRSIPLATFTVGNLKLQLGLAASVWVALGHDDFSFPLITEDFYMGIPIYFRYKDFSGSIALNHISAHQGDGMDIMLEKSLSLVERKKFETYKSMAEREGLGLSISDPEAYSRDFLSIYIAYDDTIGAFESRIYGHFGYVHKMIPEELKRFFIGDGFEVKYPHNLFAPYYSQDITWNADTDSVDYSGQLGVFLGHDPNDFFSLRLALIGFVGHDRRGQMLGRKDKRLGIGIFIR